MNRGCSGWTLITSLRCCSFSVWVTCGIRYYQHVHLDSGTGKVYLEFPQGPFTHFIEIDPSTGQDIRRFMVREFRHIEKCEFLNDRLYFLYQPDVGTRIKKVYSIWI